MELKDDALDELEERLENNEVLEHKTESQKPYLKPSPTDEILIEELLKKGTNKMGRHDLRTLGYKGELGSKIHFVGKYKLEKAVFSYTYYFSLIKGK